MYIMTMTSYKVMFVTGMGWPKVIPNFLEHEPLFSLPY